MNASPINLQEKFAKFAAHWSPHIVARMNDYHFKLARIEGEFVWHSHAETDEAFIVVEGEMTIALRDRDVHLQAGEMFVVPRGTQHKPSAARECKIMLVERADTVNTGDAGGALTASSEPWI